MKKVGHMILFFAEKLQPWKTTLNKLLFYSDFVNFKKQCFSISGLSYRAIELGPVPSRFDSVFANAIEKKYIIAEYIQFKECSGEKFLPGEIKFDETLFEKHEIEIMEMIADKMKKLKTQEVVDLTHEEDAWKQNIEKKDIIKYNYAFQIKKF
jgi:uncharacterized phage-associated protein